MGTVLDMNGKDFEDEFNATVVAGDAELAAKLSVFWATDIAEADNHLRRLLNKAEEYMVLAEHADDRGHGDLAKSYRGIATALRTQATSLVAIRLSYGSLQK